MKADQHAREIWGEAYADIPKSVFATLAWHLANRASDTPDLPGAARKEFFDELTALTLNGIIPGPQYKRVCKALPDAQEQPHD